MAISIKSEKEIELMKEAGRILAITHEELEKALRPGMSTWDINKIGEEVIRSYGCIPSFLNYHGYPASICVSYIAPLPIIPLISYILIYWFKWDSLVSIRMTLWFFIDKSRLYSIK